MANMFDNFTKTWREKSQKKCLHFIEKALVTVKFLLVLPTAARAIPQTSFLVLSID